MIRLALPVHPTEGYNCDLRCPVFACDVCGEIIDSGTGGMVLWNSDDDREQFHVHKGVCDRRLEASSLGRLSWRNIDDWLAQLINNYADPLVGATVTLNDGERITVREIRYGAEVGEEFRARHPFPDIELARAETVARGQQLRAQAHKTLRERRSAS